MHVSSALLSVCTLLLAACDGARILALFPYNARSHFVVMEPLLLSLHARGHHITVVSSFPQQRPLRNYRDIDLSSSLPVVVSNITLKSIKEKMPNIFFTAVFVTEIHMDVCEKIMRDERVLNLLNEEFDLVIGEIFGADCFNYISYKLKVPLISWITSTALPWAAERAGLPDNPSYIPNYFVDYSADMNFAQRLFNTITLVYAKAVYYYYSEIPCHRLAQEVFNEEVPSMDEVNRQTSLLLVNSHASLLQSRPFPPNVVEVGGIHIKEVQPLPKDLKIILDNSKDGVILFSFGSLVRVSSLPRPLILMFLSVFATIPQQVIFKYEEELPEAPPNVIVRKWLPQTDIIALETAVYWSEYVIRYKGAPHLQPASVHLSFYQYLLLDAIAILLVSLAAILYTLYFILPHPNLRAVITHCGLASTIEAVHFAKPVIGIPFFSDQFNNAKNLVRRGVGLMLDIDNLSVRQISEALRAVLENPSYTENMKKLSLQFRDRPMTALETAVYWSEYVIRYKGAPHLQPASVHLSFYQYLLLDAIAILLVSLAAILYTLYFILRLLCFVVCNSKEVQKQTVNNSKKVN